MKFLLYCNLPVCTEADIERELQSCSISFLRAADYLWLIEADLDTAKDGNPIPYLDDLFHSHLAKFRSKTAEGVIFAHELTNAWFASADAKMIAYLNK